jgi:putative flippase GtrA
MAAIRQAMRYCIVGLISTAINYIMFIAAIAAGLHYLLAATISSVVTVVAGYFLHRGFTFSAPGAANIREFASFLSVFAVQYVLAMAGYTLLIGYLGLGPSLAFVLNNIVVASVAFSMLRYRTFRGARRG